MRRSASEVIRELERRIAHLEKSASADCGIYIIYRGKDPWDKHTVYKYKSFKEAKEAIKKEGGIKEELHGKTPLSAKEIVYVLGSSSENQTKVVKFIPGQMAYFIAKEEFGITLDRKKLTQGWIF